MPRHAVSRTSNVERTGRHKWVKSMFVFVTIFASPASFIMVYYLLWFLDRHVAYICNFVCYTTILYYWFVMVYSPLYYDL